MFDKQNRGPRTGFGDRLAVATFFKVAFLISWGGVLTLASLGTFLGNLRIWMGEVLMTNKERKLSVLQYAARIDHATLNLPGNDRFQ
jgi:hypothetical protein